MKKKLTLWTQGPMRRIFPLDKPPKPARSPITIHAARGETECLQVGIHVEGQSFNCLTAEVSDLKGPQGVNIRAEAVNVLYPETVPVKWAPSGQAPGDVERPAPGFFPDPLLDKWEFITAGSTPAPTRSVWLRIRVPRRAMPGLYHGSVTVTVGSRNFKAKHTTWTDSMTAHTPFTLRVWNFELPEETSLLTTLWFFPDMVAKWYKQSFWSPAFWQLLERFADDMAAHRQNVILTPLFGANQEGPHPIVISRRGHGYTFDFSRFDRWCRLFLQRGFKRIEGQHIAGECKTVPTIWETRPDSAGRRMTFHNAQDPRYEEFLEQFMQALWNHLGERGWQDRYLQHISDEPNPRQFQHYKRLAGIVRRAAPGIRLIDAVAHAEYAHIMDHPVPLESRYEALMKSSHRRPEDVWVYYCCGPTGAWPNRFIDYLLIRTRIIAWLCFQKEIPGFLHWGYNYWGAIRKEIFNPWDDTHANRWPSGDPMMVYPPRDQYMPADAITGSIRWEIMREALEDYEYLCMTRRLAEAGDAEAKTILDKAARYVIRDWTTYTRNHEFMESVRCRMGQLLSRRWKDG